MLRGDNDMRRLSLAAAAAALFVLLSSSNAMCGSKEIGSCGGADALNMLNTTAPDFTLTSIKGKKVTLATETEKRLVLLNFWATWCTACREEMDRLNELNRKFGRRGIRFLSVNYKDSEAKVKAFVKKSPIDFTLLLDEKGGVAEDLYGLVGLPVTFVVDTSGTIVYSDSAPPTEEQLEQLLEKSGVKTVDYGLEACAKAPAFKAPTDGGKTFDLAAALKKGPVVLVFYRGGWCPYCSTQLRELQKALPEFKKRGATLAAVSVDKVENARATKKKENLGFPLLSDPGAEIVGKYGLKFHLDDETVKKYKSFGADVESASGRKHHQIAVPAVYVIDRKGVIRWVFVNEDYKKRAKPADILKALDALKK